MKTFRTFLLVIVASVMLVGGIASTANADTTAPATTRPAPAASTSDPGDPGIPPD